MSTNWPLLKNAPISEALIDIRVQLPEVTSLKTLEALHYEVRDSYPNKRERYSGTASLGFSAQDGLQGSSKDSQIDGMIFENDDRTMLFQARLDGFTVNKLRPYDSWQALVDEAKRLWFLYDRVANPENRG